MPKLKPETMDARKAHILQAALTCFANSGYHLTSVDDIVQQAGLSKGSIYTHFESKKALFLELLNTMLKATGLLPILGGDDQTGREKLESAMTSMMAFVSMESYKEYATLLMDAWALSKNDAEIQQALSSNYTQLRESFTHLIEQSIVEGEIKPVNSDALASIFISVFDGLMVQASLDDSSFRWQDVATTIQFSWMEGLLADHC
jgi:AcrR family transcriptional regulator